MEVSFGVLVFCIGLILGSFFNVCIFRIPREESIAFPASHCSICNKEIKKYDLIPVISYVVLKGKCRSCGNKISIQYPLVEILTAVLFTILYINFGFTVKFFLTALLTSILIITSVVDINTGYIYEFVSIIGILGGVGYIIYNLSIGGKTLDLILGGIIAGAVIGVFAYFNAMGWGDVEMAFMCGLYLGVASSILMLGIAIILGGIVGSIILITKKKSGKGATMAFGPYIGIGGFISLVYGQIIIEAFLSYYGF